MVRNALFYGLAILLMVGLSLSIGPKCADAEAIGVWLFDEGSGDVAEDSSGNDANGSIVGDPEWVDGKFGKALKFEPNKYVDFPQPLSEKMILKRDFTVMAWVKPQQWVGGWNCAFSMQAGSTNGETYGIYFGNGAPGTEILLWTRIAGGGQSVSSGPGTLPLDEWTHAAVTYDGSMVIVYKNGEQAAEQALSGDLDNGDGKGRFVINGNYNSLDGGLGEWCSSIIDEVLIFEEVLSQDKIKTYMEKGFKKGAPVEASGKLVATWGKLKVSR